MPAMWRLGILLAVASCGRVGFADLISETTPDGASPSDGSAAQATPDLVACGAPQRFTFDTDEQGMGVAARASGFDVFDIDSNAVLWGYSYTLGSDGVLAAVATKTQLGTGATGDGIGGASIGDRSVVAAGTSSTSTMMLSVDATFASAGSSTDNSGASGTTPIASNGSQLLLTETDTAANAVARMVNIDTTESATTMLGSASLGPYFLDAMATTTGFAVGWGTTTPVGAGLAILDANANLIDEVALKPSSGTEMYSPWFAYSAGKNAFIVAWHQKDGGPDDVWAMILDGSTLNPIVPAFEVLPSAANVVAAADDDGFWLAYQAGMVLGASHIDIAGNVTPRPVTSSGGTAQQWNVVERDGQAILVWTESGGTGPNLYLDPFCN
jgi:hypothetical protein